MNLQIPKVVVNHTSKQGSPSGYAINAPRYTSYPTANHFTEKFTGTDYLSAIQRSNRSDAAPLSLYFHIPFCEHLCFYCGCSKILTKKRDKGATYLAALFKEISMMGELFDNSREVLQLHVGGGTPTFLTSSQLDALLEFTARYFRFNPEDDTRDFSIEIDPRTLSPESISALRTSGFNRISLGVQDFDPKVQKAIHRIQPREMTTSAISAARQAGFRSINVDLIYGLPFQTPESFAKTIAEIIDIAPDRISLFNYAHMPDMFPAQRRIDSNTLPDESDRLTMFAESTESLVQTGYDHIGLDHFALQDDELTQAKREGTIHRNFQGYTTHGHCDLVGMGLTSISKVADCYSQNTKDIETYYQTLEDGDLPCCRGIGLDQDDEIRRYVIEQLMCNGQIQFESIRHLFGVSFLTKFADLLQTTLQKYAEDRLISIESGRIVVLPAGKPLIRIICSAFDAYRANVPDRQYSRAI